MNAIGLLAAVALAGATAILATMSCEDDAAEQPASSSSAVGSGGAATGSGKGGGGNGGGGSPPVIEAECEAGWCRIPAGSFVIGSPENECGHPPSEETQVPVTLTRSFLIGQHEVTQAEWTSHGLTNPSKEITGNPNDLGNCLEPDCPVGSVNWFEAAAFSNVLSTAEGFPACYVLEGCTGELGEDMSCTGMTLSAPTVYDCSGYRLPTEAEWEYAARAGTTTPFYSGPMKPCPDLSSCYADPNLEAIAWYCLNADKQSHPVGQLMPNGWGLYDIIGNHYEWAHNVFTPSGYGDSPLIDPLGEAGSVEPTTARTLRGGAYVMWNSICRVSERLSASMGGGAFAGFGVRIVRTLAE